VLGSDTVAICNAAVSGVSGQQNEQIGVKLIRDFQHSRRQWIAPTGISESISRAADNAVLNF
jgi:hypothetical protein